MLRGLILENFKAFGGRRVIPIKPITLIFGPNSAGKSAIIQSLLLLKQTYEQPPKSESGSTVNPHGRYFDFGTFSDYVHMHDTDRRVEITPLFERRVANGDEYYFFATSLFNAFDLLGIGFVISSSILNEAGEIYEQGMYFGTTDKPLLTFMPKIESLGDVVDIYWDEFSKQKDFVKYMTELLILKSSSIDYNHDWIDHVWNNIKDIVKDSDFVSKIDQELENARSDQFPSLDSDKIDEIYKQIMEILSFDKEKFANWINPKGCVKFSGIEILSSWDGDKKWGYEHRTADEKSAVSVLDMAYYWYLIPDMTRALSEALLTRRELLEEITYLGPLRSVPDRVSVSSGKAIRGVGGKGEFAPEFWFRSRGTVEYVNSWLTQAAIPYLLDVRKVGAAEGDDADSFAVELVDRRSGIRLSWKDVGFGFSQVLPLIMALATQPQNGTLLVEQPELHLHPRLQAELADLVVESVHLRTDADLDKPRQPTVIMETHSEHLLLRLMRRMRETAQGRVPEGKPSLTPAEVSIIYVHPMEDGSGSIPIVIDLDKEGNLLTAWPNGFFEEGFNERFA